MVILAFFFYPIDALERADANLPYRTLRLPRALQYMACSADYLRRVEFAAKVRPSLLQGGSFQAPAQQSPAARATRGLPKKKPIQVPQNAALQAAERQAYRPSLLSCVVKDYLESEQGPPNSVLQLVVRQPGQFRDTSTPQAGAFAA